MCYLISMWVLSIDCAGWHLNLLLSIPLLFKHFVILLPYAKIIFFFNWERGVWCGPVLQLGLSLWRYFPSLHRISGGSISCPVSLIYQWWTQIKVYRSIKDDQEKQESFSILINLQEYLKFYLLPCHYRVLSVYWWKKMWI